MINAIGDIAKLATTLLTLAQKKPLTALEQIDGRIKAEEECTAIIQKIDKAEKDGNKEEAQATFHNFIDALWNM